jgi:hypothetical protein
MFRASSAHHQESLTVHTASSFCVCVCLRHCLVRNWLLVVRLSVYRLCRQKIKIYHKLHLLIYLLEYVKMHRPGNIKFITRKLRVIQM